MIGSVLTLIQTLLQIILLRKGPDALPRSPVVVVVVVGLWLSSSVFALLTVESYTSKTFLLGLLISCVGFSIYALVVKAAGKAERLQQTLIAIIGCGAIFGFALLIAEGLLPRFLNVDQVRATITLIWLWSVPVEGHIIARSIDRLWYVGLLTALTVFIMQLFLLASLGPVIDPQLDQDVSELATEVA
jgi:hypothetical protein